MFFIHLFIKLFHLFGLQYLAKDNKFVYNIFIDIFLTCYLFRPICRKIWKSGSTVDVDISPLLTGTVATFSWLWFGLLIEDPVMIRVNALGFSAFFSYISFFYFMSYGKRMLTKKIATVVVVLGATMYIVLSTNDPSFWSGWMAIATSLTFITSPLASLSDVVKNRSTETLPFWMILFNFLVSSLWTLYGYLMENYFLVFPNGVGAGLSFTQLILFLIYPSTSVNKVKTVCMSSTWS